MNPAGPCGCSPLGPGPTPTPTILSGASMPLGWAVGRPLSPMCCYAQPNRVPDYLYLWAGTAASVSNATGHFAKHVTSTTSPPPLPLARGTSYFGTAVIDPFLIMGSWQLVDIKVVCAGAAVATATVGADPRFRLTLVQTNISSNTLITDLDLPCISGLASIGINNDASGRTGLIYFAQHFFSPPVRPNPFTMLGWYFTNLSATNNQINAYQIAESALVFKGHF